MKTKPFIALFVLALFAWNAAVGQEYIEVTVMEVSRLGESPRYFPQVDNGESIEFKADFRNTRIGVLKPYLNQGYKIKQVLAETVPGAAIGGATLKLMPSDLQPHLRKSTFSGRNRIYILYKE